MSRRFGWQALLEVVLFWVEEGVKIFRVDNPHTKPFAFWEWLIGEVRRDHPDVLFLSEAFTRPRGGSASGLSESAFRSRALRKALALEPRLTFSERESRARSRRVARPKSRARAEANARNGSTFSALF